MARVLSPSDRAPRKKAVDLTVLGHAMAKGSMPVPEMTARIALVQAQGQGEGVANVIDKSVRVVGARSSRSPDAQPLSFMRMPITWERAYGGIGTPANPIGCGEDDDDDDLPNVVDLKDPEHPAGFGPISAAWPVRKKLLGATPSRDVEAPVVALPSGFDFAYFQCAPPDQQAPELSPDAVVVLEGFDAERDRIELKLPGAAAVGAVYGLNAADPDAATPIDFRADALHIDTDAWTATITFRGSVEIRDESRLDQIVVATGVGIGGELPYIPERRPAADQIMPAAEVSPDAKDAGEAAVGGTLMLPGQAQAGAGISTLPLPEGGSFANSERRSSDTLVLPLSSWSAGPTRDLSTATLALPPKPSLAGPLPPPQPLISPPPLMPLPAPEPAAAPASPASPPEPPAFIGAPPLSPVVSEADKKPEEIVDIDRYGEISAELAERGANAGEVLAAHKVSRTVWRKADRHWRSELEQATKNGERALIDRFDDAYVKSWEKLHPGRFGLPEYARLSAAERSARLSSELSAQGLDTVVGMRLRRVWKRRVAADAAMRDQLKKLERSGAKLLKAG